MRAGAGAGVSVGAGMAVGVLNMVQDDKVEGARGLQTEGILLSRSSSRETRAISITCQ